MKYTATTPDAIIPNRTVLLLRQTEIIPLLTAAPIPSLRSSPVGPRPDQRIHHPCHRDLRGVEGNRVDLPRAAEAFIDVLHTVQPLQGRFPHIVSGHVECDRGISLALRLRVSGTP